MQQCFPPPTSKYNFNAHTPLLVCTFILCTTTPRHYYKHQTHPAIPSHTPKSSNMKFTAAAAALLATASTVAAKNYLINFPEGTSQNTIDAAISKLEGEGAKITHKYSERANPLRSC